MFSLLSQAFRKSNFFLFSKGGMFYLRWEPREKEGRKEGRGEEEDSISSLHPGKGNS